MAINIKISSDDTIEHGGKQYKPVAIRKPKKGDVVMSLSGHVNIADKDFNYITCVILEEVIPPYRTPTDEDAKQRPMAEFWDGEKIERDPYRATLIAVKPCKAEYPFVSLHAGLTDNWRCCRIPNEQRDAT